MPVAMTCSAPGGSASRRWYIDGMSSGRERGMIDIVALFLFHGLLSYGRVERFNKEI